MLNAGLGVPPLKVMDFTVRPVEMKVDAPEAPAVLLKTTSFPVEVVTRIVPLPALFVKVPSLL